MKSRLAAALIGGAAGAVTVTALHQILKHLTPDAPRLDRLAKQALAKGAHEAGAPAPPEGALHWIALAGDLAANTAYYSAGLAFGPGTATWLGPLLGAGAGVGSIALPAPLGLDDNETARTATTKALAFGLYFAGSVAATATYRALLSETEEV